MTACYIFDDYDYEVDVLEKKIEFEDGAKFKTDSPEPIVELSGPINRMLWEHQKAGVYADYRCLDDVDCIAEFEIDNLRRCCFRFPGDTTNGLVPCHAVGFHDVDESQEIPSQFECFAIPIAERDRNEGVYTLNLTRGNGDRAYWRYEVKWNDCSVAQVGSVRKKQMSTVQQLLLAITRPELGDD
jgi:hypothetical protein